MLLEQDAANHSGREQGGLALLLQFDVVLVAAIFGQNVAEEATISIPKATWFGIARTGRMAAVICEDLKIRVWALPERRLVRTLDLGGTVLDQSLLSDDGSLVLLADMSEALLHLGHCDRRCPHAEETVALRGGCCFLSRQQDARSRSGEWACADLRDRIRPQAVRIAAAGGR